MIPGTSPFLPSRKRALCGILSFLDTSTGSRVYEQCFQIRKPLLNCQSGPCHIRARLALSISRLDFEPLTQVREWFIDGGFDEPRSGAQVWWVLSTWTFLGAPHRRSHQLGLRVVKTHWAGPPKAVQCNCNYGIYPLGNETYLGIKEQKTIEISVVTVIRNRITAAMNVHVHRLS